MNQEIHYSIHFSFPSEQKARGTVLPFIDMFLHTLEEADRSMAGALGLEIRCLQALKEMGKVQFLYTVSLILNWPVQFLLGDWPEPEMLRTWMNQSRRDLFEIAGRMKVESEADLMAARWDNWAHEAHIADALVYNPINSNKISILLEDLRLSISAIGGKNAVEIQELSA